MYFNKVFPSYVIVHKISRYFSKVDVIFQCYRLTIKSHFENFEILNLMVLQF